MGLLGLEQLLYYAEKDQTAALTALKLSLADGGDLNGFPLAIVTLILLLIVYFF
jgi:hypothetical protein